MHPNLVIMDILGPRKAIFEVFAFVLGNKDRLVKDNPTLSTAALHNMLFDLYQCLLWYNETSTSTSFGFDNMRDFFQSFR